MAFATEYERTGDPALLFGQAQALRRAGDCRAAIDAFERFIATAPPEPDTAAASAAIHECREILGQADERAPETAPESAPPVRVSPAPAHTAGRRWFADPAGGALVGFGIAMTASGAGLFGGSYRRLADRPSSEAEYEDRRRRVRAMWGAGIGLLAAAGVLIVAGAIRCAVVARATERGRSTKTATSHWHHLLVRF